ncbi:hypothetical protein, partial [Aeromonas sp. HMWF017]
PASAGQPDPHGRAAGSLYRRSGDGPWRPL